MTPNKNQKLIREFTASHFNILLLLFLVGALLIYLSQFINNEFLHHLCRDLGISLIPISLISFIYEYILRKSFMREMKEEVIKGVDVSLPSSLRAVRNSGIVDVNPRLDRQDISNYLHSSQGVEIKILDIFFEDLQFICEDLKNLVENGHCNVKILLWNIDSEEFLQRRAMSIGNSNDITSLMANILENIRTIEKIYEYFDQINLPDVGTKFQVKFFNGLITNSIFSIGQDYYLGFYLRGKYSSQGTQIKVSSGRNRYFFEDLCKHFQDQWLDKDSTVTYKYGDLNLYEKNSRTSY
jgi:hypothetical protein